MSRDFRCHLIVFVCAVLAGGSKAADREAFESTAAAHWQMVWFDAGTEDWREHWFLDGENATVTNTPEGMNFAAGPTHGYNPDHAVLWTQQSFSGDVRIDFEYTKTDDEIRNVNIIYVLASGKGEPPYVQDIFTWRDLRREPWMKHYFDHMNTYHVSFAAFPMVNEDQDPEADYIRARRYLPQVGNGLKGTALQPDYEPEGLFKKGVPHQITVIKRGDHLFMRVQNAEQTMICHWPTSTHPDIESGRIGFRHMFTRSARYRNIRISTIER